ncbi:hypothetical protein L249_6727 [Ophiocordyceps polyrhachis-furcata BCC 54312]|uniref:NADH-ubiquinone oxidoreductase 17.8 kDa subunit n=1 Tax=Ophiocordyceps polyrhachis-furcata BCC 54312 TaxID=1330021 RepID=A0A367LKS6_9HYPO|nr:hypothetical protein L249_6727 [Ophiocordyceps polyrhachis-furcata BCC 54312]
MMLAARRRLRNFACHLPRTARSYASDAKEAHPEPVNESFGKGSILTVSAVIGIVFLNYIHPAEGEESPVTKFIQKYTSRPDDWAETNALHTKTMEQAGFYRNLFENASNKHRYVDVSFPEAIQSYGARNIPAGHLRKLDDVIEHYRQQHIKEEEKKAKKLAAQSS